MSLNQVNTCLPRNTAVGFRLLAFGSQLLDQILDRASAAIRPDAGVPSFSRSPAEAYVSYSVVKDRKPQSEAKAFCPVLPAHEMAEMKRNTEQMQLSPLAAHISNVPLPVPVPVEEAEQPIFIQPNELPKTCPCVLRKRPGDPEASTSREHLTGIVHSTVVAVLRRAQYTNLRRTAISGRGELAPEFWDCAGPPRKFSRPRETGTC